MFKQLFLILDDDINTKKIDMRHTKAWVRALPASLLALSAVVLSPMMAKAAHPLLTEDTGTQGSGNYQLEITYDTSGDRKAGTKARSINSVLTLGLTDDLDAIITLPHERLRTSADGAQTATSGFADLEIAAKWRFYEQGALSFALRPGVGLPTEGLSTGQITPSLFAVSTYTTDAWAFHLHVGYARKLRAVPDERSHIYHASVAAEYRVSDRLRLVSDLSIERNPVRAAHPNVGSMVMGLVVSLMPNLDFDFGYRKGLTEPADDFAWLTGFALRF